MRWVCLAIAASAVIGCHEGGDTNPLPKDLLARGTLIAKTGGIQADGHVESEEGYTFSIPMDQFLPTVRSALGSGWDEIHDQDEATFKRHSPASNLKLEEVVVRPGKVNVQGHVREGTQATACSVVWVIVGRAVN